MTSDRLPAESKRTRATGANRWLDQLECLSLVHQMQLMIWVLLFTAFMLACLPFEYLDAPRQGPSTPLSWLPHEWLVSTELMLVCRVLLFASALFWLLQMGLPWSSWSTVVLYTIVWSLKVENTYNTAHILHMANMLLVVAAIWVTFYHREIRAAVDAGTYFRTPLVPCWITLTAIAYVGIFHTAAGLSKLLFSGMGWANGVSLQLWAHAFGYDWSPAVQWIVARRDLTMFLQAATLVVETVGVLAVFPRLRTWVGLAIIGFYGGVLISFPYGFFFNAILTAILLLPVESVITWLRRRNAAPQTHEQVVLNSTQSTWRSWIAARFDLLGCCRTLGVRRAIVEAD